MDSPKDRGIIGCMIDWPHAPVHRFGVDGVYFVTAATYEKRHHYRDRSSLDRLLALLVSLARQHDITLQAWCLLSNHYHLVAQGPGAALRIMLSQLHSIAGHEANDRDCVSGRKVWFQFRDTQLTYERSWLARLRYTHENAVKHGLVRIGVEYPWSSAAWFERVSSPALVKTLRSLKIDRVNVPDEFEAILPDDWD